jgi:hypothetical protein
MLLQGDGAALPPSGERRRAQNLIAYLLTGYPLAELDPENGPNLPHYRCTSANRTAVKFDLVADRQRRARLNHCARGRKVVQSCTVPGPAKRNQYRQSDVGSGVGSVFPPLLTSDLAEVDGGVHGFSKFRAGSYALPADS